MNQALSNIPLFDFGSNYEIERRFALGGMAELLLAWQTGPSGFRRKVIIKRPLEHLAENAEFIELFRREATIASGLSHRNIVTVYEVIQLHRNQCAIVMEYVPGETVYTLLRKAKEQRYEIPMPAVVHILNSVAHALDHAYTSIGPDVKPRRIVHRDVSPINILLSRDGQVKLADFGIARSFTTNSVTKTGATRGKLMYMSPEQVMSIPLDQRSDLFSLGVVGYELTTGIFPFNREHDAAVAHAVLNSPIRPPDTFVSGFPEVLSRIIMKALERPLEKRYASAAALSHDLEQFLGAEALRRGPEMLAQTIADLFPSTAISSIQQVDWSVGNETDVPTTVGPITIKRQRSMLNNRSTASRSMTAIPRPTTHNHSATVASNQGTWFNIGIVVLILSVVLWVFLVF